MGKHLYWNLFLNKVADLETRKVFSCEYCDIFKSDFFHRSLPVDTSQNISDSDAPRCSIKKILKNFERLTGKQLCQSLLFNKVAGLGPATLLKKRLRIGVFLKILKNTFFSPSTSSGCLH